MVLINDELYLIENSKEYLNVFLSDSGAFSPFAMIMDKNGIAYPLEYEIKEKHSDPNSLIALYEQTFINEIKAIESEYQLGIICIDVFILSTINGTNTKRNAVEIRLIGTTYQKKIVLFYETAENREVIFQELVEWDNENSAGVDL